MCVWGGGGGGGEGAVMGKPSNFVFKYFQHKLFFVEKVMVSLTEPRGRVLLRKKSCSSGVGGGGCLRYQINDSTPKKQP